MQSCLPAQLDKVLCNTRHSTPESKSEQCSYSVLHQLQNGEKLQGHRACSLFVPLGEVLVGLPARLPEPTQQLLDLVVVGAGRTGQVAALQGEGKQGMAAAKLADSTKELAILH